MDSSSDLLKFKKTAYGQGAHKTAGSRAGSQRSKLRGPSSVKSSSKNPWTKEINAAISEKDNPNAIALMNKIEEMRVQIILNRVVDMYEALLQPKNRERYLDSIEDKKAVKAESQFRNMVFQMQSMKDKQTNYEQVEKAKSNVQRTQVIEKFQLRMNIMILAFKELKKCHFQNDNYRISRSLFWENWEESAFKLLDSPFVDSKIFIAKQLKKMSCQAVLKAPTRLPEKFSDKFLDLLVGMANGSELGEIQRHVIEALESLTLLKTYRDQLIPYYEKLIEFYKQNLIYNVNMLYFANLLAKITLFQDIDYQKLDIDNILLKIFFKPIRKQKTAFRIIRSTNPDFVNRYEGLKKQLQTGQRPPSSEAKVMDSSQASKIETSEQDISMDDQSEKESVGSRQSKVSRSGSSISSIRRMQTRNAFAMGTKTMTNKHDISAQIEIKKQRLKELRSNIENLEQEKADEILQKIKEYDIAEPHEITKAAALGISRLLIPATSVTILNNVAEHRPIIYDKLLNQGYIQTFMKNEALETNGLFCQYLTTILSNFLLQTTYEVQLNGEPVINIMNQNGLLELISSFCKNPNLSIKANAAWLFTAICINRLVNPLELTKCGLIRDIFVLYLDLHKFNVALAPTQSAMFTSMSVDAEDFQDIENQAEELLRADSQFNEELPPVPLQGIMSSPVKTMSPIPKLSANQNTLSPIAMQRQNTMPNLNAEPDKITESQQKKKEARNIIDEVLQLYDYEHFDRSIWEILNMKERIQHLIFSIFTYLSIYDDPNIVSAVHKVTDVDVDKKVEEIALCGLKELLERNPEKMKLFIEILIQFTICDDLVFQENGIWYLKHIIINEELSSMLESQNVDILEVFIAGSICESSVIQQECVIVLTYLAIEKKAYRKNEDLLLDSLMFLTTAPSSTVRGLAFNGLACLALHGEYAQQILLKQASVEDYYNTISQNLKQFRNEFVTTHYNSETISQYSGINLLLGLSRSATLVNQNVVCDRIPDILNMICAQNKIISEENINEVGCFFTIRALMCSQSIEVRENFVVPFTYSIAQEPNFRNVDILINPKFVLWCLNLLVESEDYSNILRTASLLRDVLYIFNTKLEFKQEETLIRELFQTILSKLQWNPSEFLHKESHEKVSECFVLIFVREKNLQLSICEEVIDQVSVILEQYNLRSDDNHLALSKHIASTIKYPQTLAVLLKNIPHTIEVFTKMLDSSYEVIFNVTRVLSFLTKNIEFNSYASKASYLKLLCDKIEYLKPNDLHAALKSIGNLLVYSRGTSTRNEFDWFYSEFYFEKLTNIVKKNQIHSLLETYCELSLKLLVEKEFCDRLFIDKLCSSGKSTLEEDLMQIINISIHHTCTSDCNDLSSENFPFLVHSYSMHWTTLKTQAYGLASQLLRKNYCLNKIQELQIGLEAVKCMKETNELILAFQKKRDDDSYYESLINTLAVFIQLENIALPGEKNPGELMNQAKQLVELATMEKIEEELQGRAGCILLHAVLNSPVNTDPKDLQKKITPILTLMSQSRITELNNLAVWGLKQLYLKYQNRKLQDFDFEEVFLHNKAIDNVVPKLTDPNLNIQENALLCLSQFLNYPEMKQVFIDLNALSSLMLIGQQTIEKLLINDTMDMKILISFAEVLASLIKGREDMQDYLIKEYQILKLIFDTCCVVCTNTSDDDMIQATDAYTKVISHLVENKNIHHDILNHKVGNQLALDMINKMFHEDKNPVYAQLKIDNNLAQIYFQIASKSTQMFYGHVKFFSKFLKELCLRYDHVEYLSQTESDTHMISLKSLKLLTEFGKERASIYSEDDLEDLLQDLKKLGLLEPLLVFEQSSVPEIREMASDAINNLTSI